MRYSLGQLSRGFGNRIESGSGVLDNFEQSGQENENGSGENDGNGNELDSTNGSEDSEVGPVKISQEV